jgi:fructose-1-phosphate kinase PfkB-like protein
VVKLNRMELSTLTGKQVNTIEDAYRVARKILDKYGTEVIVTLGGANDSLAVLREHSYLIPAPEVKEVVSTLGAGDDVLAGLGYALAEKKSMEEGFRLGFAAAGAAIMTLGPADCRKTDVDKLLPTIQSIPFK